MDPKSCPICGASIAPTDSVCPSCGASVAAAAAAPPVESTPAQPEAAAAQPAASQPISAPSPAAQPAAPAPQPAAPAAGYGAPAQPAAPAAAPVSAPAQAGTAPTQPGYGAPAAAPSGYGTAPSAGYGAPQAGAGAPSGGGYGAPPAGPGAPAGGGYGAPPASPGAPYGGYRPPPPPPKKKNTALIIILCIVGVVVVGGGIALFLILGGGGSQAKLEEYQVLLGKICDSSTPEKVSRYSEELATFAEENPDIVDKDLLTLMEVCDAYVAGDEDEEDTYTDAIAALKKLVRSTVDEVGACAETLLDYVNTAYEDYQYYYAVPPSSSSDLTDPPSSSSEQTGGGNPFAETAPYTLKEDWAEVIVIDGKEGYRFSITNTSNKTITYFEVWMFCYDDDGNPIDCEWDTVTLTLAPGETYVMEFDFRNSSNVTHALPFVNYVTFDDGSFWGISDDTPGYGPDDWEYYFALIQEMADAYAKERAA